MTPERRKWWDSLPKEEKYIRKLIKHLEDDKKRHKANIGFNPLGNLWMLCVKDDKMLIKALRKQIAMRPLKKDHRYEWCDIVRCSCCYTVLDEADIDYCPICGQKVRW